MNVLIIFTHPNRNSLNGEFLNKTLEGLALNPAVDDVQLLDLYGEDFEPRLRFDEEHRRRDMHRNPVFEEHRRQLSSADVIVFIHPIWWGRPPAMLLGYIDQLFASDFAYRQLPGKALPEGLFAGKQAIFVSTMKGPAWYPRLLLGNSYRILMKRAVMGFIGIKKVKFFEFGNMEKSGGGQIAALEKVKKYMEKLV